MRLGASPPAGWWRRPLPSLRRGNSCPQRGALLPTAAGSWTRCQRPCPPCSQGCSRCPFALEPAESWATAGRGHQKCPPEPPVYAGLPAGGAVTLRGTIPGVLSPCAKPFVPRGLSKPCSPSTSCQSPGHRGVSGNSCPNKCYCSCLAEGCTPNPCQMCWAVRSKAHRWCKSISRW